MVDEPKGVHAPLAPARSEGSLCEEYIDGLDDRKAAFILRCLLASGQVSKSTVIKAFELAQTISGL